MKGTIHRHNTSLRVASSDALVRSRESMMTRQGTCIYSQSQVVWLRQLQYNEVIVDGSSDFGLKPKISFSDMGTASSMLTQYDIEEVQEHCNNLCGSSLPLLFFFLFIKIWKLGFKLSFPAGNCVLISKVLSTWPQRQGIYFRRWVLVRSRICHESTFSGTHTHTHTLFFFILYFDPCFLFPSLHSWWILTVLVCRGC